MRRAVSLLAMGAVLLLLWQLAVWILDVSPVLLPSPLAVGRYLSGAAADGSLGTAVLVTARRLLVGYAIGIAIGLPAGFLLARFRTAADTLGQLALGLQTLPSVCWVPLALVWFGQSEAAMTFVVLMGTVWAIMLATWNGILSVPPIYARAARTMGAGRIYTLVRVALPASLPFLIGGMKQGWAFAWRSLMAAEIYVTILSGFGLGNLLHNGRELLAMDQVVGVMLVIVVVGLLVDRALFAPAEAALHRRWGTGRQLA